MNSLQSTVGMPLGYVLYFAALLLTAAQLAILLQLMQKKLGMARILAALLHFLLCFFLLAFLLDYSYNAVVFATPEVLQVFELRFLALPWLLYAGLEMASAGVVFLQVRVLRRYRETRLTPDTIRQTVDLLPTGLVVSEPDGTVLLANLSMTELCRKLTGELLSDAGRFWQYVESKSENGLIRTADGETSQFQKSLFTLDGKDYDQITAADMTEQYRVTEELSQKNLHLKEVQDRMKTVAAKERSLVADREIMQARMTVHDRMGAVLLSGKYYLDHPENVKEDELLRLLEFSNHFLLGEVEQPENKSDPMQEAILTAKRIGVAVEIFGEFPKGETAKRILAQAVDQCAANTARHAGGDLLSVALTESGEQITASFSNNGRAPEGPITETGGLAVLRKTVEAADGSMTVQNEPVFLLTITIPKQI